MDCQIEGADAHVVDDSIANISTEESEAPGLDCDVTVEEDDYNMNIEIEDDVTSSPEPPNMNEYLPFQNLALELEEDIESPISNIVVDEQSESTVLSNDAISSDKTEETASLVASDSAANSNLDVEKSFVDNDDIDVTYDNSSFGAPILEDTNDSIHESSTKTYLEDFLMSPASNSVPDSDSVVNEDGADSGHPLHRFPTIVKSMETADYETLQIIYRLLYLRNAWDTEKILAQRILEFSGFNCDEHSEDYYTRLVMLRTLDSDIISRIGKLLCISGTVGEDPDKKFSYISKVMKFLSKPRRPVRKRTAPKKSEKQGKAKVTSSTGGRKKLTQPKASEDDNGVDWNPSDNKDRLLSFSELCVACDKPGPLSHKLKVSCEKDARLKQLEKEFIEKVKAGNAPELKIILKKVNPDDHSKELSSQKNQVSEKNENDSDSETITEEASCTSVTSEKEPKKKLKDFAQVLSSIEGTPEELLAELHMVIFLKGGDNDELKDHILDFDGFAFTEDSEDFEERKECLKKMKEDIVKNMARALYLDPKNEKEATISHILNFLKAPNENLLRPTVIAPGMLSDLDDDIDFEGMSDSDDSITCEVVEKKVECIDLLSSGDESDKEDKETLKEPPFVIKTERDLSPKLTSVKSPLSAVTTKPSAAAPSESRKRYLRDFETITKIVNTHPTEYLVDIYNLLYMKQYELATLRKDILDFSGFEFQRGTPEYTKRKQFLDRMLYNSVRRIYNTLIHNTRETKVFSKPTMISEIFQFLLKLPDTDTSIRPSSTAVQRPNVTSYTPSSSSASSSVKVTQNLDTALAKGLSLPSQSGRLSDLKRVFQRVACFPCEYLVDVHKLLFMTDCEMIDIRANIFGFKGFSFDVDSPEFNQRKMYLEYLTFHSLRKISSVLTTKTVDLRNSTKHELANHLTEVLKEYTAKYFDQSLIPSVPVTSSAASAASIAQAISQGNPAEVQEAIPAISPDAAIEQIVVTPIIEPLEPSPINSPEPPKDDSTAVSSTTSGSSTSSSHGPKIAAFGSVVKAISKTSPKSSLRQKVVVVSNKPLGVTSTSAVDSKKSLPKMDQPPSRLKSELLNPEPNVSKALCTFKAESASSQQFADINLPELEKYKKMYEKSSQRQQQQQAASKPIRGARLPFRSVLKDTRMQRPMPPNTPFEYRPEFVIQQVAQPYGSIIPTGMQLPLLTTFPQQLHIQPQPTTFVLPQHALQTKPINTEEYGPQFFAETVMGENVESSSPPSKRLKRVAGNGKVKAGAENLRIIDASSLAVKRDETDNPSSTMHSKIRDAMTKASEDEEDCDKPLSTLVGHPNDKVLKQQICEIVEKTDLQEITINGVIQKIFNMYPKFNLNYRKDFIKSTLRSLLYRLGEQENSPVLKSDKNPASESPDCSVSTTDPCDSPDLNKVGDNEEMDSSRKHSSMPTSTSSFQEEQSS